MTKKPYKEVEFKQFLKMIGDEDIPSWSIMAQALDVDRDTITAWKRTPEARRAQAKAIKESLKQMKTVGEKDWRMWEARLKMLGVNPADKLDVTDNRPDSIDELLIAYGIKERQKDDGQADGSVPSASESEA